jgi:hypothetical protein
MAITDLPFGKLVQGIDEKLLGCPRNLGSAGIPEGGDIRG